LSTLVRLRFALPSTANYDRRRLEPAAVTSRYRVRLPKSVELLSLSYDPPPIASCEELLDLRPRNHAPQRKPIRPASRGEIQNGKMESLPLAAVETAIDRNCFLG